MPINPDVKIWRYIDLAKFISLLTSQQLHLTRLDKFPDKWEGTWPRKVIEQIHKDDLSGEEFTKLTKEVRQSMYVSCWHRNDFESAALWDLYALKSGLAIETTVGDLQESLMDDSGDHVIDEVRYLNFDKENVSLQANFMNLPFLKRKSFEHEREVRLMRWEVSVLPGNAPAGFEAPSHFSMEVDLPLLVKRVHVAPTAGDWLCPVIVSLCEKFGLHDVQVTKSGLYDDRIW